MPVPAEIRAHGGVVRVRTFRRNGTLYRIYFYRKKGKDGRKTYVDKVRKRR